MGLRPNILEIEDRPRSGIAEGASCDLLLMALPEGRGLEIWREIGGDQILAGLPVAILTVQNQRIARILDCTRGKNGLEEFAPEESEAQLRNLLRAVQALDIRNGPLETGAFLIDPLSYRVTHAGKETSLSVLEFRLLYFLSTRPHRFFTRDQIHAAIWHGSRSTHPRVVDVYVRRLRMKIEADPKHPVHIKTVRGMGYLFDSASRPQQQ
jgi:DNA-binding response OmpR family regulator